MSKVPNQPAKATQQNKGTLSSLAPNCIAAIASDSAENALNPFELPDTLETKQVVFLLTKRFSLIAFSATIEPLRMANRLSRRKLFSWQTFSETGEAVTCSNGVCVSVDSGLKDVPHNTQIWVVSGIDAASECTKPVLTWLRRQSRLGAQVGALCTASHILAKAGLLNDSPCTIHWENKAGFEEDFPEIEIHNQLFALHETRSTCAGGIAGADMILTLISQTYGSSLANAVADQILHPFLRSATDPQRLSIPTRIGVRHPKLIAIIQTMQDNLEEPISPSALAQEAKMSTRQLERLFRRYLNKSPKRYYMELRLQRARHLLLQTNMTVMNVALACGFASPSHFSKCYRSLYNCTPYRERGTPEQGMHTG